MKKEADIERPPKFFLKIMKDFSDFNRIIKWSFKYRIKKFLRGGEMKKIKFPYCISYDTIMSIYGCENDQLFQWTQGEFEALEDEEFSPEECRN